MHKGKASDNCQCPVCGGNNLRECWEIDRADFRQDLLRCSDCDYHVAFPRPSAKYLEQFYGSKYGCYQEIEAAGYRAIQRRVNRINKVCKSRGRLLDLGGGIGTFTKAAIDDGWDAYSIESSQFAHQKATEQLGNRALATTLDNLPPAIEPFDAITLWAVAEHLTEPMPILTEAVARLKPMGILYIQTPFINSFAARAYRSHWRLLLHSPDHVGFFTERTMQHICPKLGLRLISARTSGSPFPFGKAKSESPNSNNGKSACNTLMDRDKPAWRLTATLKHDIAGPIARAVTGAFGLGDNVEFVLQKIK